MKLIGLTGGIASGKTTVSKLFASYGIPVIDADKISHQIILRPDIVQQILLHFGDEVCDFTGKLDRRKLGKLVFAKTEEREWLNQLMHPAIREEIEKQIQQHAKEHAAPYLIIAIPLLSENIDHYHWLDEILVVDAPKAEQISRAQQRDHHSAEHIERVLSAQHSRKQRLRIADYVIDNHGDINQLKEAVATFHRRFFN